MTKTDKMLLIEERAGQDIRDVMTDALEAENNLRDAATWIERRYGVPMAFGLLSDWIEAGKGSIQKTLVFAGWTRGGQAEPSDAPVGEVGVPA